MRAPWATRLRAAAPDGSQVAAKAARLWAQARPLALVAQGLTAGVLSGQQRSIFKGSGQEVEELREYVEGDDPRSIDAGVSARMGRPFVKRFIDERQTTLMFVLDRSRSMGIGGHTSLDSGALLLLATLARAALQRHDRVGLVLLAEQGATLIAPSVERHAGRRLLEAALRASPQQSGADWEAGLRRVGALLHRRAAVVLISDFLDGLPGLEAVGSGGLLGKLARHHEVLAVRLLAAEQTAWPVPTGGAPWRVRDPESQRQRYLTPAAGHAFVAALLAQRQQFARAARRLGIDPIEVLLGPAGPAQAITRALARLNGMRRARRLGR
jgi:uncharacterized protein (DUF58 family)